MNTSIQNEPNQLDLSSLERPSPTLLTYYLLTGICTGPGLFIAIPLLILRYNTLRYRVEETGIRMQVGLFFRKEVVVAFRRIQDIHVSRNLLQRWLGISSISVQTASGNAMPEIVLEGMTKEDQIRDWLYERMRGAKGQSPVAASHMHSDASGAPLSQHSNSDNITSLLSGIRDNLAVLAKRSQDAEPRS